ncbi:MAG: hypothetical protein V6Z89_00505 [Desulfobacter sp.]
MDSDDQKVYRIKSSFTLFIKFLAWILLILAFSMFGLPFIPEENPIEFKFTLIPFGLLGCASLYCFYIIRMIPKNSIVIDEDGIWYEYLNKKDGLIPWKSIEDIKEKLIGQRLVLICRGVPAMKIEYQISNFESLRSILADKVSINIKDYQFSEYAKPYSYHIFYFACLIGFAFLGFYVGKTNPFLGYLGMAVVVIGVGIEYIKSPYRIKICNGKWKIKYPMKYKIIKINEISDIKLADTVVQGNQHSEVHLVLKSSPKPIKLKGMGVDSIKLYKLLTKKKYSACK